MNHLEKWPNLNRPSQIWLSLTDACGKETKGRKSAKNSEMVLHFAMKPTLKMMFMVCNSGPGFDQTNVN